jgi:hypothetical protein
LSLDDASIQSRIALYSETTKGQVHADDSRQFQSVADRFIAALSARELKELPAQITVPFFLEGERIVDQAAATDRLREIIFSGVFSGAEKKRIVLLDTLEQMEQLLEQRVPAEVREQWSEHVTASSRIALVSGGPMLVGLSLRKANEEYSVSGLLFAYFPKHDAKILRAGEEALFDQQ